MISNARFDSRYTPALADWLRVKNRDAPARCAGSNKQRGEYRRPGPLMDQIEFVEKAPLYYAVAIGAELFKAPHSLVDLQTLAQTHELLRNSTLFDHALTMLKNRELVVPVPDDFGPLCIKTTENYDAIWSQPGHQIPLLKKYNDLGDAASSWLSTALQKVDSLYTELAMTPGDFAPAAQRWTNRFRQTTNGELCTEQSLNILREAEAQGYTLGVEKENLHCNQERRSYALSSLKRSNPRLWPVSA